jgi:peptide deformylase
MIKQVLMLGNKTLRQKSIPIDFEKDNIEKIIMDLKDTLHYLQQEKKIGRAIAGVQIGCLKRIIYMESNGTSIIMINPEIIDSSNEKFEEWDSCFSADVAFFGKTSRNKNITVKYFDESKNKIERCFYDDLSELFQHEIEHLNGIIFTDHIINNQIIMRNEWEKLKK